MNPHAKALGKLGGKIGGKSKSPAKAAAARENGKLGGKPKKPPQPHNVGTNEAAEYVESMAHGLTLPDCMKDAVERLWLAAEKVRNDAP